jgi:DNA polymerase-3 subunit delta
MIDPMSHTVHAFEYLAAPEKHPPAAVNVLMGDESFLRGLVLAKLREHLAAGRDDIQLTTFEPKTPWRDVNDELSTGSLFGGGGKRLVMIEDADSFVTEHRAKLEDCVAKPKSTAVLILAVDSWPSNTKLYKAIDAGGLQIQCGVPTSARSKDPDISKISKWLIAWGKAEHNIVLEGAAADELVQIVGPHLGVMNQDLAKLALYVKPGGKVSPTLVKEVVGGWRMRTAWQMLDDVANGKAAAGLTQLDHLIRSGSEPIAIFGQISWSLRRFAAATRIYEASERKKMRLTLGKALEEAGIKNFPPGANDRAQDQLKQLTRRRAAKLYHWLLEVDLSLKGSHSQKDRARLAIEMLFLKLAEGMVKA